MIYKRLPLIILSLFFYGSMLFLTINALDIHYARLPKVTAKQLSKQEFMLPSTDDPTKERRSSILGIPKELFDFGRIFIVETVSEYDITYYYAKEVFVTIDIKRQNEDYYAITKGLTGKDKVILTGYEMLKDGMEIYPLQESIVNP